MTSSVPPRSSSPSPQLITTTNNNMSFKECQWYHSALLGLRPASDTCVPGARRPNTIPNNEYIDKNINTTNIPSSATATADFTYRLSNGY
eukprot:scaffold127852_cov24-Cyclotella_meneghiniana.AAC.2